jgi:PKHD-type hydroxylase
MMLHVPRVLTAGTLERVRSILLAADWVDGRVTAGHQSARVKNNQQLPEDHPAAREAADLVLAGLQSSPLFVSAALPHRIFPPLFNRYEEGMGFGAHVDNAVRGVAGTSLRLRTDVSATLFLSEPDSYDGGELVVEDTYGDHAVKLPAGDLVVYPASSLHRVTPIRRGVRLASFFWIQSLVGDVGQRSLLFDLDMAIMGLSQRAPDDPAVVPLTGVYHNLLRRWAQL